MFEKEAEEYLIRNLCKTCLTICENNCPHAESEKRAFKDGAEFAYNKANEWHYVKDGDLPKENKICLLYLGSSFNPITGWIKDGVWYFEDDRDLEMWQDEVIAWKEIVLPKESE